MGGRGAPAGDGAPPATAASPPPPAWLRALGHVPLPLMHALAWLLAVLMRHGLHYRVAVARDNLARALPGLAGRSLRRVLWLHYLHLAEVLVELPRLAVMSRRELLRRVQFAGLEEVRSELAAGRSVLLLAAHYSNWEWLLQALATQLGAPFHAAYKPPHSEAADRLMLALRGRFGVHMVPAKRLLRELVRARGTPHAVGMVADQVPTSSAGRLWLRFLGRETAFFPGPGEIARIGGYRCFLMAQRRLGPGRYLVDCQPLTAPGEQPEPGELVARYAAALERLVRAAPEDWAWTHRRWKLAPPPAGSPQP